MACGEWQTAPQVVPISLLPDQKLLPVFPFIIPHVLFNV
jgi:hypothetical protein